MGLTTVAGTLSRNSGFLCARYRPLLTILMRWSDSRCNEPILRATWR
jgi:hypothetical protein